MNAVLHNINFLFTVGGSVALGVCGGVIGCFALLRKRALLGDALAHAALPGICLAFMLTGVKSMGWLLVGATLTCWLGALTVDALARYTRVKEDSALGITLSVFFGVGILLLTHIQKTGAAAQAGLDKFLFGQAAAMLDGDVALLTGVSLGLVGVVALAYKEFKLVSFDPDFATAIGMPVRLIEFMMATLVALAVVVGLQAVGVVLMAAMLVTPAASARFWTDRLGVMIALSGAFGALSGALGAVISYTAPKMPTGPWIVVAATTFFIISLCFAPRRGLALRWARHIRRQRKTASENILRTLYRQGEEARDWTRPRSTGELLRYRPMSSHRMTRTLHDLCGRGLIREPEPSLYALTETGLARAERLTRLHRLWELYLTRKVEIAPDHVHDDAEEIEHILTPELEARLLAILESPSEDPHARRIPQSPPTGAAS